MIGTQLGQYQIVEQVGAGAQATVYRGYQPTMGRYVAIKILPRHFAADPTFAERFHREARLIARLEHAHILPVYDYGEDEGIAYLVMRYLEAGTLRSIMTARQLPLSEITHVLCQVASALDYAHRQGVVHRDVKPANIMIDREGNAYLTDFGVAKIVSGVSGLTASGTIGTPAYMAPEQGMSGRIDGRSDLYALGVLFYQLVTGALPFDSDTPVAVILMHINDPVPPVVEKLPDLPEGIEAFMQKAMAKDPDERFQTGSEFCDALSEMVGVSGAQVVPTELRAGAEVAISTMIQQREAAPEPEAAPARAPRTRRRGLLWGVGALAAVAIAAAVAIFGFDVLGRSAEEGASEAPPAEVEAGDGSGEEVAPPTESGETASEEAPPPAELPPAPSGDMPFVTDLESADPLTDWEVSGDWRVVSDFYDMGGELVPDGNRVLFSEVRDSRLTVLSSLQPQPEWVTAEDVFITMRVKLRRSGAAARLLFSQSSGDDYYALDFSTSNLILRRFENGEDTLPPENTGIPLELGRWYDLWIWRHAGHVAVYVNDQWFLQALDQPSLPPGTIGLETLGDGGVFVDDLTISRPDPASEDFEAATLPETWTLVEGLALTQGANSQAMAGVNLDTDEVGPITEDVGDFTLTCQVQVRQGEGGLQFRKGSGGYYEVTFAEGHVSLWRYVSRGADDQLTEEARNVYGPTTTRTVVVKALGPHITVLMDGQVVAEVNDPGGQAAGTFAVRYGEVSDIVIDDCAIASPPQPSNTGLRFAFDLWESILATFGPSAAPALTDDFDTPCDNCWVGPEGAPASGPGEVDPGGFYTITSGADEGWWLFEDESPVLTPFQTTTSQPSSNYIAEADVQVTEPEGGGESSGWLGVRAEPSFVGEALEQIRIRLTRGPDGNTVTVESAGTVSQEVYYTGAWPGFDEVGDGWHHVTVVAQGDALAFFVNDQFVTTVAVTDEDRLLGTLSIGVSPDSSASFDNIAVWDLRDVRPLDRTYRAQEE